MKFILTFSWEPDAQKRDEGMARFRQTEGSPLNDRPGPGGPESF